MLHNEMDKKKKKEEPPQFAIGHPSTISGVT